MYLWTESNPGLSEPVDEGDVAYMHEGLTVSHEAAAHMSLLPCLRQSSIPCGTPQVLETDPMIAGRTSLPKDQWFWNWTGLYNLVDEHNNAGLIAQGSKHIC